MSVCNLHQELVPQKELRQQQEEEVRPRVMPVAKPFLKVVECRIHVTELLLRSKMVAVLQDMNTK